MLQTCAQIGEDPLCEIWYSTGFRGISGRIGNFRTPTGMICAIGPGYGLMQNVQATCRACGDVGQLLQRAGVSAVEFLGIQEDFLGVMKYFNFSDLLEQRMLRHNENSQQARAALHMTEAEDFLLPQCTRRGRQRRLEPGISAEAAGIPYAFLPAL